MKVKLLREAKIRHHAGEIVEVSPAEAGFLFSTKSAVTYIEPQPEMKPETPEGNAVAPETPEAEDEKPETPEAEAEKPETSESKPKSGKTEKKK
jgi:hypothetical protein